LTTHGDLQIGQQLQYDACNIYSRNGFWERRTKGEETEVENKWKEVREERMEGRHNIKQARR
jgi:hypothetical protein